MQKYSWQGLDKYGNSCNGKLDAESASDLKSKLFEKGIALLKSKKSFNFKIQKGLNFLVRFSQIELINFFQNLSTLIESGIDLLTSISLIKNQIKNKAFKNVVLQIESSVDEGLSFSDTLQKRQDIFSPFMVWMVRVGERIGKLDFVLKQLCIFLTTRYELTKKLKQAALLPTITISFALLIISGIFIFVVPQFSSLYFSMDKQLPVSTQLILKISNFLRSDDFKWWFLGSLFCCFFIYFLFKFESIRNLKDKFLLKIFFIKDLILNFDLICFLSVLSICLNSGITLSESLKNSLYSVKNFVFRQKILQLTNLVNQGTSFTQSLKIAGENFFPQSLIVAASVGERTGNLDLMLQRQVDFFKKELDSKLYVLTTFFQPVLMIFVGILIALLMLSVYLPIFDMANLF
ncbi:MAG: type II secretion system F family protein [bacterium]